jgi:hypothetical protein
MGWAALGQLDIVCDTEQPTVVRLPSLVVATSPTNNNLRAEFQRFPRQEYLHCMFYRASRNDCESVVYGAELLPCSPLRCPYIGADGHEGRPSSI